MDLRPWALAFTLLDWPERQKADCWAALEAGFQPILPPEAAEEVARLQADQFLHHQAARDRGARLLLPGDPGVDALLAPLPYPVALWVRGTLPPVGPRIAVVGSRRASSGGKARTRAWAKTLAEAGVAVLSGLARGIDGAAHEGALEAHGGATGKAATWGVLGSGLDHPYPPEHKPLMDRMVQAGGGVLTPFPPEALPLKWHFPRRNWLLAAWVDAVLVMEAARASGSLVTAKLALDLGKELYVVPGSEGTDALLDEGAAHPCTEVGDLLAG